MESNNVEGGVKFDGAKPMFSLIPPVFTKNVANVLTFGAQKYSPNNWQKLPDAKRRYTDALMRHLNAWRDGEVIDPESGLSHLGHMGCCVAFLTWFEENEKSTRESGAVPESVQ